MALLLGKGADVSLRDEEGNTALSIALDVTGNGCFSSNYLQTGSKDLQNLIASKTIAALDETKRKYELAKSQNEVEDTR